VQAVYKSYTTISYYLGDSISLFANNGEIDPKAASRVGQNEYG